MKTKLILAWLFCTSLVHAQVTVDWFNYPGGVSVALDSVNNVYTANWDYNPAGDITLTKRNAAGVVQWNAGYNNTDNTRHEVATWVATDHAGDIVVSGTIRSGYSNPVNAASLLMKFNASGTLLWRVVYESSFDGSSTRKCLIDANNNIYVLGIGTGPLGQVTKVKKFNAAGVSVWNYFDATAGGLPVNFKFTPDNKILIIHRSLYGSLNSFSKMDLNGNNSWSLPAIQSISGGDAAGDAFGNTYIVNGAPSELKKLNPNGTLLWTQSNGFNGNKVEVGSDNQPVVGGYPLVNYGVVMAKYNSSGTLVWQNLDADGPALSLLALAPMRLDASNAVYVAGSTMSSMGLCKVNSNGTSAWATTTPSGYPVWFEFGRDNNVYVTGGTTARFVQPAVIPCNAPVNLTVSTITATSAKLNWSAIPNSIRYTIFYKKSTDTTWTRVNVSKTKTSWTLNNLVCGAGYKWKIRTVCDTVGGVLKVSAFSPVQIFNAGACRIGAEQMQAQQDVFIYPNPVNDFANLSFTAATEGDVEWVVYDALGRVVQQSILKNISEGSNEIRLNLAEWKIGVYFCSLNVDGEMRFIKIIKK